MSFPTAGLRLDQAPPLAVPASFFLTAPVAAMAAGALLLVTGADAVRSPYAPSTLALTHLGTLGFLGMGMVGALYQVTPVVAGAVVPAVRLAHAVHAGLVAGIAGLAAGLLGAGPGAVAAGAGLLLGAFAAFGMPVGWALARARPRHPTVHGMRLAVVSLAVAASLGAAMAAGHAGAAFPGPRPLWIQVHLGVALLGWVGGLLSAVSWQVLPMFYLAQDVPRAVQRATVAGLALGTALPLAVLAASGAGLVEPGAAAVIAGVAALPAALAAWGLHPLAALRALANRRRKRADPSLAAWTTALRLSLTLPLLATLALVLDDARPGLLFGWVAVWGWAGLAMHGMLGRILPFLVWFHRFSGRAGQPGVPSMNELYPPATADLGRRLHLAALVAGAGAVLLGSDLLSRLAGLLLVGTGAWLLRALVGVVRARPAEG